MDPGTSASADPAVIDLAYLLLLGLAAPYVLFKLATRARVRAGLAERLGLRVERRPGEGPCIWIHGVSVGEVLAAKPLVQEIEHELPGYEVAISTTTNTGLDVARKHFPGKRAFYYPLDLSFAVKRVLDAIRPAMIVLVELEIWPNFLREAYRRGIPVVLVNGRISEKSYRGYRFVKRFLFRPLAKIRCFCVQTGEYAGRFIGLGVPPDQVLVTGTLKYDSLPVPGAAAALEREYREKLALGESRVLVCGSTHPPEEREVIAVWKRLKEDHRDLKLVLVPRHVERVPEVVREARDAGVPAVLKTALDARKAAPADVVIVDTMGELAKVYACATVVFVGGSLVPHGGQNMLEPAGLGRPTIFGPHVANFRESADLLLAAGAAEMVDDGAGLERAVRTLLGDPERAAEMGQRARATIDSRRGAAAKTVAVLRGILVQGRQSNVKRRKLDVAIPARDPASA